jgi:F-type H+-transporting ATPase subunit alpha
VGGAAQIKAMKKVAGPLRLELAQYRELAAFSKFSSDLDKATQAQLIRGERILESLKQRQFKPMPVEKQVAIIYAASHGYLDDISLTDVERFEKEYLNYIEEKHRGLLSNIKETGDFPDELAREFDKVLEEFKKIFLKSE